MKSMFIECLLFPRHCYKHLIHISEQNIERSWPPPHKGIKIYKFPNYTKRLHSFSILAITNYYKHSTLKQPNLLSYCTVSQKSNTSFIGLKWRYWLGYVPFWRICFLAHHGSWHEFSFLKTDPYLSELAMAHWACLCCHPLLGLQPGKFFQF